MIDSSQRAQTAWPDSTRRAYDMRSHWARVLVYATDRVESLKRAGRRGVRASHKWGQEARMSHRLAGVEAVSRPRIAR
jgi:hypothetical protein